MIIGEGGKNSRRLFEDHKHHVPGAISRSCRLKQSLKWILYTLVRVELHYAIPVTISDQEGLYQDEEAFSGIEPAGARRTLLVAALI
jgi:hypothetical protein